MLFSLNKQAKYFISKLCSVIWLIVYNKPFKLATTKLRSTAKSPLNDGYCNCLAITVIWLTQQDSTIHDRRDLF